MEVSKLKTPVRSVSWRRAMTLRAEFRLLRSALAFTKTSPATHSHLHNST